MTSPHWPFADKKDPFWPFTTTLNPRPSSLLNPTSDLPQQNTKPQIHKDASLAVQALHIPNKKTLFVSSRLSTTVSSIQPYSPGTQPWHLISMANFTSQLSKSNSSNYYQATRDVAAYSNIQASAYTVDAVSMALKGFHYSTSGAGGTYNAHDLVVVLSYT